MTDEEWIRVCGSLLEFLHKKYISDIPYVRFDGVHVREAFSTSRRRNMSGK